MQKIVFVISHKPDNRYLKRINLLKNDYELKMLYWNKSQAPANIFFDNAGIVEIHIPANQTNPLARLPQTVWFIRRAYKELCRQKPDVIYVGNIDMLYIARKYKHRADPKVKIVYEIADLHRLIIDRQKTLVKKGISVMLKRLEKSFAKDIDCLVLTSMKFYEVYYSSFVDKNKVVFLPNMPEKDTFAGFVKAAHEKFTVGFIGLIRYKEQLKMLIDAAEKADVNVVFAGEDWYGDAFKKYCSQFKHVTYIGPFSYKNDIQKMYRLVDCVYAVYDADMTNVRVALPNKLYESILCEMPIIVAKGTYLSELVLEMGVGSAVSHKDTGELVNELIKLSTNHEYYNDICQHCRAQKEMVDLEHYNNVFLKKIQEVTA